MPIYKVDTWNIASTLPLLNLYQTSTWRLSVVLVFLEGDAVMGVPAKFNDTYPTAESIKTVG